MGFPEKLKTLRKKLKVSQEQLGEMTGLSRRAISQYEMGENIPRTPAMMKLAEVLGVSVEFLINDSITELPPEGPDTEPYVDAAREKYGDAGAMEISQLLDANRALFAGGELSEDAKDDFFRAVTEAYFAAKEEAKRRKALASEQDQQ